MEISNQDLCTVIVPTKNRIEWINRLLLFYEQNNFQHKIIIADSSEEKIHKNLIEIIENVHYMNRNTKIYADKVELDLLKKKMKISMVNQNDNIQITGKY